MSTGSESAKPYILATGENAVSRLALLDRIFAPATRELLLLAGLRAGMNVVEVGCGVGMTALWIASEIGSSGNLIGLDSSADQLRVAEKLAADAGLKNISFRHAEVYATGLPRASFDLVYSRFLLCHVADPRKALAEMAAILKPGGILVCEDHDDGGIFTEPPTHAYKRLVEISNAVNHAHGLDSYVGLRLPSLFRALGFARPNVRVYQPVFLRGDEKRFWEITLQEAAPSIIAAGASTPAELESLREEMRAIAQDESVLLMLARVTQVWDQKTQ
jgi:ubiquinone/menaquinone biosynthesis C-methylase UbiE